MWVAICGTNCRMHSLPTTPAIIFGAKPWPLTCPYFSTQRDFHKDTEQAVRRSEEHTSELQSLRHLVCRRAVSALFPYTTLFRSPAIIFGAKPWPLTCPYFSTQRDFHKDTEQAVR